MTNEQKAQEWYKEWDYFVKNPDDAISFAAFCLDKMDKEVNIPLLIAQARDAAVKVRQRVAIDYMMRVYVDEEYTEEAVQEAIRDFENQLK